MTALKIGSLFAGYGGLDLATEAALDARTAWVSEIDPGACKVLAHRFPDAPNLGDITTIDWAAVPKVDIITGGSPCQDLSTAGRRAGMTDGTRSNLWVAMREAIANVKPTFVIWENVAGAYSAHAHSDLEHCTGCMGDPAHRGPVLRALHRVVGDLSDLGYDTEWRPVRASDVGACHRRLRVFVLAWRRDAVPAHPAGVGGREGVVDPELHGATIGRSPAVPHEPAGRAAGPLALLPSPVAQPSGNSPETHLRKKPGREVVTDLAILVENGLLETGGRLLPTPRAQEPGSTGVNAKGGPALTDAVRTLLPTPKAHDGDFGLPRTSNRPPEKSTHLATRLHYTDFGQYAAAIARQEDAFGYPAPAPTEPGKSRPRLSAEFASWMMGLPPGWITDVPGVTRNEALRLAGNGVVPAQAFAALQDMLPHALSALQERSAA